MFGPKKTKVAAPFHFSQKKLMDHRSSFEKEDVKKMKASARFVL